jgi:anti-sigma regulatory factor (Ser/Thr protein kinase)
MATSQGDLRTYPDEVGHRVASRFVSDGDAWVRSALARLVGVPGVYRTGLALAEGGGRRLLFCASDRDNNRKVDWCEIDAYEHVPLNRSVRTGEAVVGSLEEIAGRYPAFAGRQTSKVSALASVPIVAAGHVQGGYVLFFDSPQRFDRSRLTELEDLGARLGADLRRAQRATSHASRSLDSEPVPYGALAATYSVPADPRAVAPARHFVQSSLAGWGVDGDTVGKAVLCLSELVTNAVIHTDTGCELRVVLDRGVLTTTVRDNGSSVVVDLSGVPGDPLAVHGRGLQLVDALSTRWGSELDAVGTTVWFVLQPASSPVRNDPRTTRSASASRNGPTP